MKLKNSFKKEKPPKRINFMKKNKITYTELIFQKKILPYKAVTSLTLFIILLCSSCIIDKTEDPVVRQKRLDETVAQKLVARRYEFMKNCQQTAIDIAERRVDSILLEEAKQMTIDTITKPDKPTKPLPPVVAIPKDSSNVEPLFEENSDTLK